jgi:hypothetical protein
MILSAGGEAPRTNLVLGICKDYLMCNPLEHFVFNVEFQLIDTCSYLNLKRSLKDSR